MKINLTDPDLYSHGDPHVAWRWLREHDPVHWHLPAGEFPGFWVLTKYDDVQAVYHDPATFSSAGGILLRPETYGSDPGGGRTLALTDPPNHRKLRALVDDWFTPRSIRLLDEQMRDIAHDVVSRALERERMLVLIQHPDQWQALSTEPQLLHSAVEEVLRWTSTATHIMRTATAQVTMHGRRIAVGDRVTLWNSSANRDESVFDDPDCFSIRRKSNRHIALGTGEHFCLRGTLGRAELRVLYAELLHSTERIELDGTPVMLSSIIVNGPGRLPVRFTPR